MSIGDTLAEARRHAGLTLTQVSQQTRVRESIIRSIEQNDFSQCGGDFYARGHIRSIANVVGADPAPLIREYDEQHGSPGAMRAAQVFEPVKPIRIREPRSLRLGSILAVVVLAAAGFGVYRLYPSHSPRAAATQTATLRPTTATQHKPKTKTTTKAKPKSHTTAKPVTHKPAKPEAVIRITATQDCWVGLNSPTGQSLYQSTVLAGTSKTWHEQQPVSMVIGNPSGITLTVDGKPQQLNTVQVVTLSINPASKTPVTGG